jgi:hypothetical protein
MVRKGNDSPPIKEKCGMRCDIFYGKIEYMRECFIEWRSAK